MRAKMTRGGHYIDDQGRRYILREMKYNGRIVWPNWSLALSTDQLRFTAAGGSSTLYVVAAGVNAIGTPVQRIPLSAEDLVIEKFGDPDGRITRDGLVFSAENLGTTPYAAVSGIYRITWPEKNLTIDLPFSQGENKIEQTIPAHDITTGVGAIEFYDQDRERVDVIPVEGGIFDVTCVKSYTHVDAEYIWSSTAHQGGDSHIGQAQIVSPQSLTFPAGSPQPLEHHSSDVTFGSNAQSRDEIVYRVIATFDNISSSEKKIYQEADRYTEVVVPVEDSYFAHIDIYNSSNLTAAGGSCDLINVAAGHYARTEYRWESGGTTFSDRYIVDDPFTLGVAGLVGTERYHIGAYNPEFLDGEGGYHVTHDNMGTNPKDQVYFTCTNLSDTDTVARTPYDTYITINNRRTKNWDTHTETTSLSTPSFSPAFVPVLGGEVEVTCIRTYSYYQEKYTWDSGVVEGGAEIHGLMESIRPTSLTVTPVSGAPNPTYVGAYSIRFGSNAHNTDALVYNVRARYDGIYSSYQRLDQLGDSYTAVPHADEDSYIAYVAIYNSDYIQPSGLVGGTPTLQAYARHEEYTEYIWASDGGHTSGPSHFVDDGVLLSVTGTGSSRYHIGAYNPSTQRYPLAHDSMGMDPSDNVYIIATNASMPTVTYTGPHITLTNGHSTVSQNVLDISTRHTGNIPYYGEEMEIQYSAYNEQYELYDSGYEYPPQHNKTHLVCDFRTNDSSVSQVSPATTQGVTGTATLTVGQNQLMFTRNVKLSMYRGSTEVDSLSFTQEFNIPLSNYIIINDPPSGSARNITITNSYSARLAGTITYRVYMAGSSTLVTSGTWNYSLNAGASDTSHRLYYGDAYNVEYDIEAHTV